MGSSPPDFLSVFRSEAGASGALGFDRFMELALYHPALGYYRRPGARIGTAAGTDFFTASTSSPVFGELVSAACLTLLGARDPAEHAFVEIGAEPGGGVLNGVSHPFREFRTVRLGEEPDLAGPCVVFSNELFDAQPFRRFVRRAGAWRELGVFLEGDALRETELGGTPPDFLPPGAPEGYVIDAPLAAAGLLGRIASRPWTGLFAAFDYGRSWRELCEETPAGTARAYHRHTQSNDLLARPGAQDITCHVCWDWLSEGLSRSGFGTPVLESLEAFWVRHAADFIAAASGRDAGRFSRAKLSLLQLLHPAHLGQKFQVLHALRDR